MNRAKPEPANTPGPAEAVLLLRVTSYAFSPLFVKFLLPLLLLLGWAPPLLAGRPWMPTRGGLAMEPPGRAGVSAPAQAARTRPRPRATEVRPSRGAASQRCDNKMYGIAALRYHDGQWEDDCRTIHEFSTADLSAPPVVHRRVLPFQSYALTKGFDNYVLFFKAEKYGFKEDY